MIFGYGDYQQGDRGSGVWALQADLTNLGFDTKGIDGVFGPNTTAAVRNFQAARNIGITGVADEGTLIAMSQALAAKGIAPMDPAYYQLGTSSARPGTRPASPTTAPPPAGAAQAGMSTPVKIGAALVGLFALMQIVKR